MAQTTQIQWTDATWNIARGCTKVDADCKFCYMYRDSMNGTRYDAKVVTKTKTVFNLPLKLKEPSKIFTSSLTDFFHEDCDEFRYEAFDIIRRCPQHIFQILTKRPSRITHCLELAIMQAEKLQMEDLHKWLVEIVDADHFPMNIWIGTSVGSQAGTERLKHLFRSPEGMRFVSFEPLYEPINLSSLTYWQKRLIDWIIIGGESGNENGKYRYRPCKVEWMESLIEQLPHSAVFVKQMGTHLAKELKMSDRHGSNINEFPVSLQKRNFPS